MTGSKLIYGVVKKLSRFIFASKITEISGADNLPMRGGYILAANHVDWLDGFYLAVAVDQARGRPVNFLSTSNNYWWTTVAVKIPSDRSAAVTIAARQLQQGKIVCNFPEGVRNAGPTMGPGKTGTVRMALAARAPVVPVGITCDAGQTMTKSIQFLLSKQHPVRVAFGPPLIFHADGPITNDWLHHATDKLMRAIAPLADKQF